MGRMLQRRIDATFANGKKRVVQRDPPPSQLFRVFCVCPKSKQPVHHHRNSLPLAHSQVQVMTSYTVSSSSSSTHQSQLPFLLLNRRFPIPSILLPFAHPNRCLKFKSQHRTRTQKATKKATKKQTKKQSKAKQQKG